jgi:hypothetical protein
LTSGSSNIDIGSKGAAADSGAIRIGTSGSQTSAYIAGIAGAHVTGSPVYITAAGQLGVLASSERYKTDVASLGAGSSKLRLLRPVSFHLKAEPHGAVQYGLIAEEVAHVYPELVIRGEQGGVEGVRYDELAPLLLSEMKKQESIASAQTRQLRDLQRQLAVLQQVNEQMRAELDAMHRR